MPIEFVGVARGVKLGGVMETYRESVRLCSKPLDMPKKVTIDVTDMGINDSVTVETLALPENVKAVFDKNFAIVSVLQEQGRCRSRRIRPFHRSFFQAGLF